MELTRARFWDLGMLPADIAAWSMPYLPSPDAYSCVSEGYGSEWADIQGDAGRTGSPGAPWGPWFTPAVPSAWHYLA